MVKPFNWLLTLLQLAQMVVGIFITVAAAVFADDGGADGECNVSRTNSFLGLAMYASYFVLFAAFFVKSYCSYI
jgi:hypothetical protein